MGDPCGLPWRSARVHILHAIFMLYVHSMQTHSSSLNIADRTFLVYNGIIGTVSSSHPVKGGAQVQMLN